MDKLLTNEELKSFLTEFNLSGIYEYYKNGSKLTHFNLKEKDIDKLIELIQSQKILHADMVIGKDNGNGSWYNSTGDLVVNEWEAQENLKYEQRERNKFQ